MLETAVNDGTQQLRLQEEITETGGVDTDIGTLLVLGLFSSIGLSGGGDGVDGLDNIIILFVVNKIVVVVGHDCKRVVGWGCMDPIRRRGGEDEDGKKETSRGGRLTGVEGFRLVLCGFLFLSRCDRIREEREGTRRFLKQSKEQEGEGRRVGGRPST